MFDQLFDLLGNIKGEICKKFGLKGYFDFNLDLIGEFSNAKRCSFVGNLFDENRLNSI